MNKQALLPILGVLLLAHAPSGVLAQRLDLQPGDKVEVISDRVFFPFEGRVTETWDGGFEIEVRGESRPRRVDISDVASLKRSRRLGWQGSKGVLDLGVGLVAHCLVQSRDGCNGVDSGGIAVVGLLLLPLIIMGSSSGREKKKPKYKVVKKGLFWDTEYEIY